MKELVYFLEWVSQSEKNFITTFGLILIVGWIVKNCIKEWRNKS